MEIRRLGPTEVERVMAASSLFDEPVSHAWASLFLARAGHHMLIAYIDDASAGFISGVEMTHPDKGTEMFLYELSVAEEYRGRGVGRALAAALANLAAVLGCYGMWVGTEPDNIGAIATYQAAGADQPDPFITLTWTFSPV